MQQALCFVPQMCEMQEGRMEEVQGRKNVGKQFGAGPEDQLFTMSNGWLVVNNKRTGGFEWGGRQMHRRTRINLQG